METVISHFRSTEVVDVKIIFRLLQSQQIVATLIQHA